MTSIEKKNCINDSNKDLKTFERVRLEIQCKLILQGIEINDLPDNDLCTLIKAKLSDELLGDDSFNQGSAFQKRLLDIRGY